MAVVKFDIDHFDLVHKEDEIFYVTFLWDACDDLKGGASQELNMLHTKTHTHTHNTSSKGAFTK